MKKAQIITVAEIRGGTGKTTTAAALAQAAQKNGKKVLVIDLDAQASITYLLGGDPTEPGAYALLFGTREAAEVIQETKQGIDLIAAAPDLYTITTNRSGIDALKDAIEPITSRYDVIIIDTPPALSDCTFNALEASNGLVIPMSANEASIDGLLLLLRYAKEIRETNKKLKVLGCILTQYDARATIIKQIRDLCEKAATANKCPYLGEIRKGVAIQEAQAYGYNLFDYAPKSKPAADYMSIYNKIIK